jgi:dTDP-4-dehydrorhamnose 3,5-epimerase
MPFTFTRLQIHEVILIEPRVHGDERGFFVETYKHSAFAAAGIPEVFVQYNHSHSAYGVLRGLHYQLHPMVQGKLLSVAAGEIFDVAVDIRRGSPTYGQWVGATLSAANHHLLYVPPGFAHGFCVVSDVADLLYQVTAEYSKALERSLLWNDPDIGIAWPVAEPLLSSRDVAAPCLRDAENNFAF